MVEVIKQIEPGSMMPSAKPRLQGDMYTSKSCDPGREEGDGATGSCLRFYMFASIPLNFSGCLRHSVKP